MKNKPKGRFFKGTKPRFPGYLEQSMTLSEIINEAALKEKEKPKKKKTVKQTKFVPCQECSEYIPQDEEHGTCKLKWKCKYH